MYRLFPWLINKGCVENKFGFCSLCDATWPHRAGVDLQGPPKNLTCRPRRETRRILSPSRSDFLPNVSMVNGYHITDLFIYLTTDFLSRRWDHLPIFYCILNTCLILIVVMFVMSTLDNINLNSHLNVTLNKYDTIGNDILKHVIIGMHK